MRAPSGNYGRMVFIGDGEADTTGDGDGTGWAFAARDVAPATQAAARTIPANQRFIGKNPPS